jgi:hypothetical protein
VTSEAELVLALSDTEPFISLVSHVGLSGSMAGPQASKERAAHACHLAGRMAQPSAGCGDLRLHALVPVSPLPPHMSISGPRSTTHSMCEGS